MSPLGAGEATDRHRGAGPPKPPQKAFAGDVDAALGHPRAARRSPGPPSVAARFVLAMTAWRMGRLDWALELVCGCHESAPMDGIIAEAMASLHAQVGNMVDSIYSAKLATALGVGGPLAEFMPAGFPAFNVAYGAIQERPFLTYGPSAISRPGALPTPLKRPVNTSPSIPATRRRAVFTRRRSCAQAARAMPSSNCDRLGQDEG